MRFNGNSLAVLQPANRHVEILPFAGPVGRKGFRADLDAVFAIGPNQNQGVSAETRIWPGIHCSTIGVTEIEIPLTVGMHPKTTLMHQPVMSATE